MKVKLPFFIARRFVAAETLAGAIPVVRRLNEQGLHVTLDRLGEHVYDRRLTEEITDTYIHLLYTIEQEKLDATISLKLSSLGQMFDLELCKRNLGRILEVAKKLNNFVRLDMEDSSLVPSTLEVFEHFYPEYPDNVGPVLQAYLKRTEQDIRRMCELKAKVRLVKGAYKEPPDVAYQDMDVIREKFIQYMKMLMTEARYPAIATHDELLIQATKAFAAEKGISKDAFEFQMLYGIRTQTQLDIVREGYHMRVYVPYGTDWFPYFYRRLRERKENVLFVLKHLFRT